MEQYDYYLLHRVKNIRHIMNLTFKEKSLYTQLIATLIAFGGYFYNVLPHSDVYAPVDLISHLSVLVIVVVIINIIGHIVSATISEPEDEDERDELILLKASKIKALLLSTGIVLSVFYSLLFQHEFWTIQILLLFLCGADIIEKMMQLFSYRKGF